MVYRGKYLLWQPKYLYFPTNFIRRLIWRKITKLLDVYFSYFLVLFLLSLLLGGLKHRACACQGHHSAASAVLEVSFFVLLSFNFIPEFGITASLLWGSHVIV